MNIKNIKIKGYNCPSKHLLMIDGEPVAFANSESRISVMISYIQGFDIEKQLNDNSVIKLLRPYRESYLKMAS